MWERKRWALRTSGSPTSATALALRSPATGSMDCMALMRAPRRGEGMPGQTCLVKTGMWTNTRQRDTTAWRERGKRAWELSREQEAHRIIRRDQVKYVLGQMLHQWTDFLVYLECVLFALQALLAGFSILSPQGGILLDAVS